MKCRAWRGLVLLGISRAKIFGQGPEAVVVTGSDCRYVLLSFRRNWIMPRVVASFPVEEVTPKYLDGQGIGCQSTPAPVSIVE